MRAFRFLIKFSLWDKVIHLCLLGIVPEFLEGVAERKDLLSLVHGEILVLLAGVRAPLVHALNVAGELVAEGSFVGLNNGVVRSCASKGDIVGAVLDHINYASGALANSDRDVNVAPEELDVPTGVQAHLVVGGEVHEHELQEGDVCEHNVGGHSEVE